MPKNRGCTGFAGPGLAYFCSASHPNPGAPRSRYILVVGTPSERNWRKAEQELFLLFCRTLGIGFERLIEKYRHESVSRLVQALLQQPSENLYQMVLEEAIQQVPGSEAGSLLVLENELYRYKAAVGYDPRDCKPPPAPPPICSSGMAWAKNACTRASPAS